jgi:hypothetical protein
MEGAARPDKAKHRWPTARFENTARRAWWSRIRPTEIKAAGSDEHGLSVPYRRCDS